MYFERITEAVLSDDERLQSQAFEGLRSDPSLHQLLPYFVQHIHKKVAHNHKNLSVMDAMLSMAESLLKNTHLFIEPYLHQLIPPILSCLVGRSICQHPQQEDHWSVRQRAAGLIAHICQHYGKSYHTLQPRIARTLMRAVMDPARPLTTQYGAIVGLDRLGTEVTRTLLVPNIAPYSEICLQRSIESRPLEASKCREALVEVLQHVAESTDSSDATPATADEKQAVHAAVGDLIGNVFLEKYGSTLTSSKAQTIISATK